MQTVGIEPGYKKILKYAVSDSGETDWAIKPYSCNTCI